MTVRTLQWRPVMSVSTSSKDMEFLLRPPLIPTRKAASFCLWYEWQVSHEFHVLNKMLCLSSIVFGAKQQVSRMYWKSEIRFSLGIYHVYTGYMLPFNRDKTHWVIPQISFHATNMYREIPCTSNPVWVIPRLSQVSSDRPKDTSTWYTRYNPLVSLYPVYTWYKPQPAKLSNWYQIPDEWVI